MCDCSVHPINGRFCLPVIQPLACFDGKPWQCHIFKKPFESENFAKTLEKFRTDGRIRQTKEVELKYSSCHFPNTMSVKRVSWSLQLQLRRLTVSVLVERFHGILPIEVFDDVFSHET